MIIKDAEFREIIENNVTFSKKLLEFSEFSKKCET